ncbi:MAG: heavy-metal-associated domain-containing protein [Planctomycetia bacterium]|nr:heavy-metal-associated domain-containing protein [Planctomycetia bacterium]
MRLALAFAAAVLALAPVAAAGEPPAGAAAEAKVVLEPVWVAFADVKDAEAAAKLQAAVVAVKGVRSFEWTIERAEAKVVREQGVAGDDVIAKAAAAAGHAATPIATKEATLTFVKKLHCPACVMKVEETARAMAATKEVEVASDRRTVRVRFDVKKADEAAYRKAITDAGYPIAE